MFALATRCKGNKGGSKEHKAQKMCFARSSASYCIHGNSHVEVEKGLRRSINTPIVHNVWKAHHDT